MEKFNQAINLLWPPDLEQRNITGQREVDENAVLTPHEPVKHRWSTENVWRLTRADC